MSAITERGLQSMMSLADNMYSAGVPASVALSVAMCKYIDLDAVGLEEVSLKKAMNPYLDKLVQYMPLNLAAIRKCSYQLHQYRHAVKAGTFAYGLGNNDAGWLFGMSTYIDEFYRSHLNSSEILPVVRKFNSILSELNLEIINASNA